MKIPVTSSPSNSKKLIKKLVEETVQYIDYIDTLKSKGSKKLQYVDSKDFLIRTGLFNNETDVIYILTNNKSFINSIPKDIFENTEIDMSSVKYLPIMTIPIKDISAKYPGTIIYSTFLPYPDMEIAQQIKNNFFDILANKDIKKFIEILLGDKILSQSFIPVTIVEQPIDYIISNPLSNPDLNQIINLL